MGRRANGEGTIQRTASGKWRAVVMQNGKWISGPSVARKTDALPMLRQKLGREFRLSLNQTVLSFVLKTVEDSYAQGDIKETTYMLKKMLIASHIEPSEFGSLDISEVTQERFDEFRAGLNLAPNSKRNVCGVVTTAFRTRNVILKYPVKKQSSQSARVLNPDERKKLLRAAQGEEKWLIGLLMQMGLRRGEALGLMHEDRDEDGVMLKRQVVRVKGKLLVSTLKTSQSEAWVPLPRWMQRYLGKKKGFILESEPGRPQHPGWVNRTVGIVAERAGIGKVTPHDLRRTSVMAMLEAGVDLRTADELHRHDPSVLAVIYDQSRRDLKRAASKKTLGG